MAAVKLFTYGTLKPGHEPPRTLSFAKVDSIRADIYGPKDYLKAVNIGRSNNTVKGFVEIIDDSELPALDKRESGYRRIKTVTDNGETVFVYEYNMLEKSVKSGDNGKPVTTKQITDAILQTTPHPDTFDHDTHMRVQGLPKDQDKPYKTVTLASAYRAYKHTPHQPRSLYLKYAIHRIENIEKYKKATPIQRKKLDQDFLNLHQQGQAAEKNGDIEAAHLHSFIHNNSQIIGQLLLHQKKLHKFLKEYSPHNIKNINGQESIALTRGLNTLQPGQDHALASYADVTETGFGSHMHYRWVPLKNLWYSFDIGPKSASSEAHGAENEFLVSPHKITPANEEDVKNLVPRQLYNKNDKGRALQVFKIKSGHPDVDLAKFAGDEDGGIREAVASHPKASPQILGKLAEDGSWRVREAVAGHVNASPQILAKLAGDEDSDVRGAAQANLLKRKKSNISKSLHKAENPISDKTKILDDKSQPKVPGQSQAIEQHINNFHQFGCASTDSSDLARIYRSGTPASYTNEFTPGLYHHVINQKDKSFHYITDTPTLQQTLRPSAIEVHHTSQGSFLIHAFSLSNDKNALQHLQKLAAKYHGKNDLNVVALDGNRHCAPGWQGYNSDVIHGLYCDIPTQEIDSGITVSRACSNNRNKDVTTSAIVKPAMNDIVMDKYLGYQYDIKESKRLGDSDERLIHPVYTWNHPNFSTAHREASFDRVGRDFFGLGNYIPKTTIFKHPVTGIVHSAMEWIPYAKHIDRTPQVLFDTVKPDELAKMAIMDSVLGNRDRHGGNWLYDKDKKIKLIDHGFTFDYSGSVDPSHTHLDALRKILYSPSTAMHNWVQSLDPAKFDVILRSAQVPELTRNVAMARLMHLKEAWNTIQDDNDFNRVLDNTYKITYNSVRGNK